MSIDELEVLTLHIAALRSEYDRVGRPILDQIHEAEKRITDIKRERGELFYVDYLRYRQPHTEECEDLEDAKAFAEILEDNGNGNGYVTGIRGPGVNLGEADWRDEP